MVADVMPLSGEPEWHAITIYNYYDGPTQFSAMSIEDIPQIYMFRWDPKAEDPDDDRPRTYKADGFDITTKEDKVDWSEAEF